MVAIVVEFAVFAAVFAVFKACRVGSVFAWRALVNGLSGMAALLFVNTASAGILGARTLLIPPNLLSAAAAGTLGVPGALLLILIRLLV